MTGAAATPGTRISCVSRAPSSRIDGQPSRFGGRMKNAVQRLDLQMTKTTEYVMPSWLRLWEQFWFTPADPALLGFIRIACGLIATYTFFIYTFSLQDFMGENAWHDMDLRNQARYERPIAAGPLEWTFAGTLPTPRTPWQKNYFELYKLNWGEEPPPPYPDENDQATVDFLHDYRKAYGIDMRVNGLWPPPAPHEKFKFDYLKEYSERWHMPPPAYAEDYQDALDVALYMKRFGVDPRRIYSKGSPIFSVFFHITDPDAMLVVQGLFVAVTFLFMIGFCTRFTTALTWFVSLCYIHRNPSVLFGVDTMMNILLLYLLIGPAGARFSVDSLIRSWWRKAKPGVVQRWYAFWKRPAPALDEIAPPAADPAAPSVAANIAIRLLQIHVCIIYLFAGVSKLQGQAWWNGGALWMTLGNYEFAPMQFEYYRAFLRFLGEHQWLYDALMTGGGLFTLVFEIGYAFLIWRPKLRWAFLAGAILLHGCIGLFMGLKTFSMTMLVMNMAFLRKEEVLWFFTWTSQPTTAAATTTPAMAPTVVPAGAGIAEVVQK
jgi:hypothetical protein